MSAHADGRERPRFLGVQFSNLGDQTETVKFGMWLFLASEILFFGGLFAAYTVYRGNHPDMFHYGQYFLNWKLGGLNTIVLITSSLAAAWSVRCAQRKDRRGLTLTLLLTLLLACVFMVVKYTEYKHKIETGLVWGAHFHPKPEAFEHLPPAARALPVPANMGIFFSIYFAMTGLHGIHVLVGMGLYGWLLRRTARGDFDTGYYAPVDAVALYWHLVDMIWIYLFPLLYLIG